MVDIVDSGLKMVVLGFSGSDVLIVISGGICMGVL